MRIQKSEFPPQDEASYRALFQSDPLGARMLQYFDSLPGDPEFTAGEDAYLGKEWDERYTKLVFDEEDYDAELELSPVFVLGHPGFERTVEISEKGMLYPQPVILGTPEEADEYSAFLQEAQTAFRAIYGQ
jgi:hypothetical protein